MLGGDRSPFFFTFFGFILPPFWFTRIISSFLGSMKEAVSHPPSAPPFLFESIEFGADS